MQLILRILIGGILIFSAIAKLLSIEFFELTLADIGLGPEMLNQFLTRILIIFECWLGFNLLAGIALRRTAQAILVFLSLLTAYLIILVLSGQDLENCGCFGEMIRMNPAQGIAKNAGLIALTLFLNRLAVERPVNRWWVIIPFVLISATIFIVNPPYLFDDPERLEDVPELNALSRLSGGKLESSQQENYVAFFSLTCEHCMKAAYKLKIASEQRQIPPVYVFFPGEEGDPSEFFAQSNSSFPYSFIPAEEFFSISGPAIPVIFHFSNGKPVKRWRGATFRIRDLYPGDR